MFPDWFIWHLRLVRIVKYRIFCIVSSLKCIVKDNLRLVNSEDNVLSVGIVMYKQRWDAVTAFVRVCVFERPISFQVPVTKIQKEVCE